MSTQTLVTNIKKYAKGWSDPEILKLIQQGQDELFCDDALGMRFIGGSNKGFPPYLKTVAGTFRYNISSANLSEALSITIGGALRTILPNQVIAVFVDASTLNYGDLETGEPYFYQYGDSIERTVMEKVPVRSFPAAGDTPATVEFFEDPGTTTEKYFCEFTYLPPRLTGVTIPLYVPVEFERGLQDFAIGEIQALENGKYNEWQQKFETYWKPRFVSKMSTGAQRTVGLSPNMF
jgi:hypothetical protein